MTILKSNGEIRGDYDENMKRALGLWGRCGGHVVSRSKCLLAGLLASQRSFNRKVVEAVEKVAVVVAGPT